MFFFVTVYLLVGAVEGKKHNPSALVTVPDYKKFVLDVILWPKFYMGG